MTKEKDLSDELEKFEDSAGFYIYYWKEKIKRTLNEDNQEYIKDPKKTLSVMRCMLDLSIIAYKEEDDNFQNFSLREKLSNLETIARYNNAVDYALKNKIDIGDLPKKFEEIKDPKLRKRLYEKYIGNLSIGGRG